MKKNKIRTILLDDEPLALRHIEETARRITSLEIVGSFSKPDDARAILSTEHVDLLLSDIQMPPTNGLSFVESLTNTPLVIFITAHPEYAINSYELDVIDYIMKPLEEDRLRKGIAKIERIFQNSTSSNGTTDLVKLKDGNRTAFFNPEEIFFIQAWGDYVKIYCQDDVVTLYYSMKEIEALFSFDFFVRIQRSYIVNTLWIASVSPTRVILRGSGESLPIGLHYRDNLSSFLGS